MHSVENEVPSSSIISTFFHPSKSWFHASHCCWLFLFFFLCVSRVRRPAEGQECTVERTEFMTVPQT